MKKTLLFMLAMLASGGLFSQIVLLSENMESYAANSFLGVVNPTWFTTWSNLPGSGEDAQVLTTYAHSGTKSASADLNGGTTDCLLKLGNKTTGTYELKWWMYIENGKCGYYNIQHFESPGVEWALEIYFRTNGDIQLLQGGSTINGTYPKATWFEVKHIIKLDADSIYLYINSTLLSAWPFHYQGGSTTGTKQLGAVDLFAGEASGSGETPGFFFDDIAFNQLGTQVPTVVTLPATAITSNGATLNGTVNANIMSTTVTFDYGLTTAYGSSIAGVPGIVTGTTDNPVSATLSGLLPGATYNYRVRGVNANGAATGLDLTFTTTPILPAVITTAATSVTSTNATLNGTVDAGGASSTVTFEYGLTTAYGTVVAGTPGTVTGNGATPVSANISGLTVNTTYHYRIKAVNSVGPVNGLDMTFLTTSCPMPSPAGTITGPAIACSNTTGNVYTVPPIANATGYVWTVPAGSTITAGANTNSITITFGTTSGNVTVMGTNTCGNGSTSTKAITVNPVPVPTLSGNTSMCQGMTNVLYSTQSGMTNYVWTVSSGGTVTAGGTATNNTVTVTWSGSGAQSISVNYTNASGCPASAPVVLPVTVNPTPVPTIGSTNNPCTGSVNNIYYTETGMSNYVWTVSAGGTIASGQGTSTLNVTWNQQGVQYITLTYTNSGGCAAVSPSVYNLFVNAPPSAAASISGTSPVCAGTNGVAFSTTPVSGADTYTWTVPAGATIASGAGTTSITVDFGPAAVTGNVTVAATNQCGNGPASSYAVTVKPLPAAAGTITGPASVCAGASGVTYTVPAVSGATGYTWTVPSGMTITSGASTNTIVVSAGNTPGSGIIKVIGTNTCGSGASSPEFSVTIQPLPAAPVITANGNVLTSSSATGNQWYYEGAAIPGATGQTYTVTNNTGYYWCVVTLNGCSSPISNKEWVVITGQQEMQKPEFTIFPVPNDGKFGISISVPYPETFTIQVFSPLGVKLYEIQDVTVNGKYDTRIDLGEAVRGICPVVFLYGETRSVIKMLVR